MPVRHFKSLAHTIIGVGANVVAMAVSTAEPSDGDKLFALHVSKIFSSKCYACHSNEEGSKLKGGLNLSSRESILEGGDSGAVLVPGNAAESLLYIATTWEDSDYEMPPKEADRLSDTEVGFVREWIDAGAPWLGAYEVNSLRDKYAEGVKLVTSGGQSDEWTNRRYRDEDIWAYQTVVAPDLPENFPGNPIDHFIGAALKENGQAPAARAGATTLIRRMTFGLTGLPPTFAEVRAFERAYAEDAQLAITALADKLLGSPQFGEQFARRWLDVVRYADSAGFANDYERPNAWRYRDYVVRSFNSDKPYDAFVREQIAGDEMDSADPEMLIATGFLRMGAWEHTAMSVFRVTRQLWLDDVTDSVGQTFLAHALQCARCHDHKFDPIPTADYYSMQAVFATTQFAARQAPFLSNENVSGFDRDKKYLEQKLEFYRKEKREAQKAMNDHEFEWCRQRNLKPVTNYEALKRGLPAEKTPPSAASLFPPLNGRRTIAGKNLDRLGWELDRYQPFALAVFSGNTVQRTNVAARLSMPTDPFGEGTQDNTHILPGGDPFAEGPQVEPGNLSAVAGPNTAIPREPTGRRLALAQWISSPENSLTARVMVNRVWAWHFGRGIAGNPNNFGATGKKPTHPELLDYLADWFVGHDWSVKALSRLIVTSYAYQRSSNLPVEDRDQARALYAVFEPHRLDAEELRDTMLAVSGELNEEIGGIPVRPDVHLEVALQPRQVMGTYAPAYEPDPLPERRNRRTLYARKLRGQRDPFLETFNQPGPDKSCELRETSIVAPQAFTLINGQETWDRALALANRARSQTSSVDESIVQVFELAYSRKPSAEELSQCLAFLKGIGEHERSRNVRTEMPGQWITRQAVDEKSGTPFEYTEFLPVYADYVADLQPADVDAATRSLANLCLAILNSNEFVYVY